MEVDEALSRWQEYRWTRAVRAVDPDRIRAEVEQAPPGPLSGTLFTVKDLFPVASVESAAGSLVLAGHVPTRETPMIASLRQAGAVCFGKGACAEFGMGIDTAQRLDGQVLHPFEESLSPGGSSGGDAVAVAAGIVDFAIGGDYGGSIRWPAQATEILGLRFGVGRSPAHDRLGLPTTGQQATYEVPGVMARDAAMMRRVVEAMLGADPVPGRTRRLLVLDPAPMGAVRPEVTAALDTFGPLAAGHGYDVRPAPPALSAAIAEAYAVYQGLRTLTDGQDGVRAVVAGREDLLSDTTRVTVETAVATTTGADEDEIARLWARADELRLLVREALADVDALVLPLAALGAMGFAARVEVAGVELDAMAASTYARAVTLTGLPAVSLPMGDHVSVQIVASEGGEHLLCDVAADLAGIST